MESKRPNPKRAATKKKSTKPKPVRKKGRPISEATLKMLAAKPKGTEKKQVTIYLSPQGVNALEDCWQRLRREAGTGRREVSKSVVIELAIETLWKKVCG